MKTGIGWLVALGAALAFATAMLLWGLAPASECSTPHQVRWGSGLPPFALFVIAGGYILVRGTVGQRLLLLVALAAVLPLYISVLSESLQIVITTEISCAARGLRE